MKRLPIFVVAILAAAVASGTAVADHGDVTRPVCADIQIADFGYTLAGVVSVDIQTVEPSCRGVTYSLNVIVDPGDPASEVVTVSSRGNGTSLVQLSTAVVDDDNIVCAYVTSSRGGQEGTNTLFDAAPNAPACVELALGGSGSTGFH